MSNVQGQWLYGENALGTISRKDSGGTPVQREALPIAIAIGLRALRGTSAILSCKRHDLRKGSFGCGFQKRAAGGAKNPVNHFSVFGASISMRCKQV